MAKMKVKDFIAKAEKIKVSRTLYQLGTFGNKKRGNYTLYDCSGLIKGILWGYPENGKYGSNGMPDINSTTMISRCSNVTTDFTKARPGWLVFLDAKSGVDHIGIYIGNGVVIESTPAWRDGVQKSFCKVSGYSNTGGLKERKWTKCGKFDKYIDYTEDKPIAPTPAPSTSYYKKYSGSSGILNTVLRAVGVPSKYCGNWEDRKPVAEANGISNYTGTSAQNLKLISLAKQGKLKKV